MESNRKSHALSPFVNMAENQKDALGPMHNNVFSVSYILRLVAGPRLMCLEDLLYYMGQYNISGDHLSA